jgi:16S rRNA processing protein RimM
MITDRVGAEEAQNRLLFIESRYLNELLPATENEDSVIGYTIRYNNADFGKVLDIMDNPAHPILEVKVDAGTILIPMVDEYIEKTDHENHVLICINLDQLLED